jgi:hypothetical protein
MMGASAEDAAPPQPPPSETLARAEARRSTFADMARGAAVAATQSEESGAGMSATPIHPTDPGPSGSA